MSGNRAKRLPLPPGFVPAKNPFTGEIVPGYLVSEAGVIWSLRRSKPMKPGFDGYGAITSFRVSDRNVTVRVARVVVGTFVRPLDSREFVEHLDNDPSNNSLANLRITRAAISTRTRAKRRNPERPCVQLQHGVWSAFANLELRHFRIGGWRHISGAVAVAKEASAELLRMELQGVPVPERWRYLRELRRSWRARKEERLFPKEEEVSVP